MPLIHMNDSAKELYTKHLKVMQTVSTEKGEILFCCEFICFSFSHFRETCSFHHPNPPFSRLFVMEHGQAEIVMDGVRTILRAGETVLLPANHEFVAEYHRGCKIKGFHLHLNDSLGFIFGPEFNGVQRLRIPELHKAVLAAVKTECQEVIHASVMSVILTICRPLFLSAAERLSVPEVYRKVLLELNSDSPAGVRIDSLAKKFHITRSALSKGFQRQFGISFKEYQMRQSILRARRLLTESNLSVDEIADSLGYEQTSYFFAVFKKMTGISPGAYRNARVE